MSLAPGVRLGAYEISALIGAGGMGAVYRAHDSRLGRDVAVKVLHPAFAADPERIQRLEQEARAAAALNHPNILAVHDVGQHDSSPYIVSELLEGQTLRERLHAGAMPVRKAVEYAIQIAHGLAAAHETGIVHRDVKPENIFVTADGRVKILDFGLAKLTQLEGALAGASALPTTWPDTLPGVVLGTIGYMAPEQVRGLPADHRSDIFAFGAVLYEMLSGQRAFRGDTTVDTMTAILKEDPADLPAAERHIPPALARIVGRCLEKSPGARFQSTHDLAFALDALPIQSGAHTIVEQTGASPKALGERLAWTIAAVAAALWLVTLTAAGLYMSRRGDLSEIRFEVATPPGAPLNLAISPDARFVAFIARAPGKTGNSLWVRPLDSTLARPLAGTEGAPREPFWSPDSRQIGFSADGKLKTVDITGAPPQTLCDAPTFAGGTWNQQDVIVFSTGVALKRVAASGGQPVFITEPDQARQETNHRWPFFLPDGNHFLFLASFSEPGTRAIYVGALDSPDRTRLVAADSKAAYAAPGYLLFVRQQTLMAQAFDPSRRELTREASPVAESLRVDTGDGRAAFSVSDSGVLTYRSGAVGQTSQLIWFDRTGKRLTVGGPSNRYNDLELTIDDQYVAFEQGLPGDIWVLDLASGITSRITSDAARDADPVWSPDGRKIAFRADRDGGNLYARAFAAVGEDTPLMKSDLPKDPSDWSRDGRYLTYESAGDVWALPLFGDRTPQRVTNTSFGESNSRISPDARWVAYQSNESGRSEVYVQSFLRPGAKRQVSATGGTQPRWSRDGNELFYISADFTVMAISVKAAGLAFEVGPPTPLFDAPIADGEGNFMVSGDNRFLLNIPDGEQLDVPITVIVNWAGRQQ
jgi:serine/threonine protein kinase/Tol biopolymer transport system component